MPELPRHRRLLPVVAWCLMALAATWGEDAPEALVTTTWEVRRSAAELLGDLRRGAEGDEQGLFERVRALAGEHGDALIAVDGVFAPLAEILATELTRAGLAERYAELYAAPAADTLSTLRQSGADSEAWRRLAATYPGTPAALEAWRYLADRAWDFGNLGTYLAVAARAGDNRDAALLRRITAAREMISVQAPVRLPRTLDLQEMWRLELPVAEVAPAPMRRGVGAARPRPTFVLSTTFDDLTAASDGLSCFLFDHLVGRRVGDLHTIGRMPLPAAASQPAAWRGGFIALGQDHGGVATLTAVDRTGQRLWRTPIGSTATLGGASAPVVIDDVVAVALLGSSEDGPELRIVAHRLHDGSLAWSRFIAKLPLMMGRAMFFDDSNATPPLMVRHGGGLLVLPSTGMMARLDALGSVQRIWTYPTAGAGLEDRFMRRRETPRPPGLASDGRWAVATPADADGFVWLIGPDADTPLRYQGDGARSTVVAVSDGLALLAGKQTTLLDCTQQQPLWHRPSGSTRPSGSIGPTAVLVAGDERLTLHDRMTGEIIADRGAEPPLTFAANDGMVIVAGPAALVAYGDSAAFIAEQQDAIASNPADYRPYVALGKVWAAQGKTAEAYDELLRGLERGAPADYATAAARLLRHQLEQAIDDGKAFTTAMGRFERLVPFAPDLAAETAFWQARRAEHAGNKAEATRQYRAVLANKGSRIELGRGRDQHLEASLAALAQAGLSRLAGGALPAWARSAAPATAVPSPAAWTQTTSRSRNALIAGDMLLGYEGGRLAARRISDGEEAWTRSPDMRLLGVRLTAIEGAAPGVAVEVLEGTAAAAAGVRNGDLITAFNDRPIRDFHRDLIPAVAEAVEGAAFTLTVLRAGQRLTLEGRLGGELVEAFAANATTCLVWPVMPLPGRRNQGEGLWVSAIDVPSGRELLRWALPPVTMERQPPRPLLSHDHALITVDGVDLVALELRAAEPGAVRWRLPGQGLWLDQASLLGEGAIMIADPVHGLFRMLDLASGEILFTIAGDAGTSPLLDGTDLFLRTATGQIACWNLGTGRQRWRSEIVAHTLVAARGDALFVLDDRKRLHVLDRSNGAVRRQYGDWTSVDQVIALDDRLALAGRRGDGDRVLAMISLPAGAPLWERTLPRGNEIREFHATAAGSLVVLAEPNQRPSALLLGIDGAVVAARHLGDQEQVFPAGAGFVIGGSTLLTGVPVGLDLPIPPALTVPQVVEGPSLLATVQTVFDELDWQAVGDGAYAVVGVGRSRIVVAKLPLGTEILNVRIASGTAPIDVPNQQLVFQRHRVARFNDLDNGWRQSVGKRIPAVDNVWIFAAQLEPPVGQTPGTPVQIRVATDTATDGPEAPWWLRRTWRQLIDPPPPPPVIPAPAPAPVPQPGP